MPVLKSTNGLLSIDEQVSQVQARMRNLAQRSSRDCVKVMRQYSEKVRERAAKYAPKKTGALERSIKVVETQTGLNGRLEFTILINPETRRIQSGRRRRVSRYAKYMHNTSYDLGSRSVQKAQEEGLSPYPIGSGEYVGQLFMTRALQRNRDPLLTDLRKAVAKDLK